MKYISNALLCCVLAFTWACQSPASEETATEADTNEQVTSAATISNADTLPYPIVAEFDELAPIFAYQNDTTYVINFWATWCAPCVEELPYFERLAEEVADQPVQIILVSLDFKRDVRTKLLRFVQERPLALPVIALTDMKTAEWIDRVDPEWGGAIPITIVYKNNERAFYPEQFDDYQQLADMVTRISQS